MGKVEALKIEVELDLANTQAQLGHATAASMILVHLDKTLPRSGRLRMQLSKLRQLLDARQREARQRSASEVEGPPQRTSSEAAGDRRKRLAFWRDAREQHHREEQEKRRRQDEDDSDPARAVAASMDHTTVATAASATADDEVQCLGESSRAERNGRVPVVDLEEADQAAAPRSAAAPAPDPQAASSSSSLPAPSSSSSASVAAADGAVEEVGGLAGIVKHIPVPVQQAALGWCKTTDTASVQLIVELDQVDEFVDALGVKRGGNNDLVVRRRLAALL